MHSPSVEIRVFSYNKVHISNWLLLEL